MKGFIIIGRSTYQMVDIAPSEMDDLIKAQDVHLWPPRFDCNKRVWPPLPFDWETIFYENDRISA